MNPDFNSLAAAGMVREEISRHAFSERMKHRAASPSSTPSPDFPKAENPSAPSALPNPSGDRLPFRPQSESNQKQFGVKPELRRGNPTAHYDSPDSCESMGDGADAPVAAQMPAAQAVRNGGSQFDRSRWFALARGFKKPKRATAYWRSILTQQIQ